jgi:2-dehydropantoate 2-reductase
MQEVFEVARARKVLVADTAIADSMKFLDTTPPHGTTSLQRDIADGRPSKLEHWNGAVVRLGREVNVATPLHEYIYRCLLPQELRARGQVAFPAA